MKFSLLMAVILFTHCISTQDESVVDEALASVTPVELHEYTSEFNEAKAYTHHSKEEEEEEEESDLRGEASSGFDKVVAGLFGVCGVFVVSGMAIGIFVWNSGRASKEDDGLMADIESRVPECSARRSPQFYEKRRKRHRAPRIKLVLEDTVSHKQSTRRNKNRSEKATDGSSGPSKAATMTASPLDLPPTEFRAMSGDHSMNLVSRAEAMKNYKERRDADFRIEENYYDNNKRNKKSNHHI